METSGNKTRTRQDKNLGKENKKENRTHWLTGMDRFLLHVINHGTYRRLQDTFNAILFIPGAHVPNISNKCSPNPVPLKQEAGSKQDNSKLNGKCTDGRRNWGGLLPCWLLT
ncbi:hypothetical protein TWF481_001798 [Arthrobotrys musiformis]|uniref:Uncharacterized protein n=1 Tax=Arthrobotrys musiformis TaxID=47236 RepID=A0AAV9VWC4_9PEZI